MVYLKNYILFPGLILVFVGNSLAYFGYVKEMQTQNIFMAQCLVGGELIPFP